MTAREIEKDRSDLPAVTCELFYLRAVELSEASNDPFPAVLEAGADVIW